MNLTTGALTALPFSPISLGSGNWNCLAVHPTGSPLVIGDSGAAIAWRASILRAAARRKPPAAPLLPVQGLPSRVRSAVTAICIYRRRLGADIAGFSVNTNTGVLTALPRLALQLRRTRSTGLRYRQRRAIVPVKYFCQSGPVFTTSGGLPSPVLSNPFASGLTEGVHGVLHPAGYYLVADRIVNQVGVYRINGNGPSTTLTAVSGSPFLAGGTFTDVLALNQSGALLFAANGNSRNLTAFTVNAGTGALTSPVTQAADTLGATGRITGLAYAGQPQPPSPPGSGFVYALADRPAAENQIYGFSVNELTGALTPLSGFPLGTGGNGNRR